MGFRKVIKTDPDQEDMLEENHTLSVSVEPEIELMLIRKL